MAGTTSPLESFRVSSASIFSNSPAQAEFKGSNIDYLVKNRIYAKLGHSLLLEVEPAVVHFGGFQIGKVCKQKLRIRNTAGYSTRVHVVPPSTPFFQAKYTIRHGSIPPGIAEEIEVQFCAQEWRYYYDCIRIHSEEENLMVPLHAYPVTNQAKLPRDVDFGKCAVGRQVERTVTMECKVPVEFEFQVAQVQPNPHFTVQPIRGIVPANGPVVLTLTFSPTRFATETAVIEVKVSEFSGGSKQCILVGSGTPGLAFQAVLGASLPAAELQLDHSSLLNFFSSLAETSGTRDPGKEGGARDTASASPAQPRRDCRVTGPIAAKLPAIPAAPPDRVVESVYLPASLHGHASMSYVLGQEPGKLRTKDIQGAIEQQKETQRQQQGTLQDILQQGIGAGVHPLDRRHVPAAVKRSLFQMQAQAATEAQQMLLLPSSCMVGEDVMQADAQQHAQAAREQDAWQYQRDEESAAIHRLSCEASTAGPKLLPCSPERGSGAEAGWQPSWQVASANTWRKRTLVLQRFIGAVRKVVYRLRAQRQLDRFKSLLGAVSANQDKGAAKLADAFLAQASSMQRPGVAPGSMYHPDRVHTLQLALHRASNFAALQPTTPVDYTDYDDLQAIDLQAPLVFRQLGYTAEELPDFTPYIPPEYPHLLDGANEESPHTSPCNLAPELQQLPGMPMFLLQNPYVSLEVAGRYFNSQVRTSSQPSWGWDSDHSVLAEVYPFHDSAAHDSPSSSTLRALRGSPVLSDTWRPRQHALQGVPGGGEPGQMAGPSPEDLMPESCQDDGKPMPPSGCLVDLQANPLLPWNFNMPEASALSSSPPGLVAEAATAAGINPTSSASNVEFPRMKAQEALDAAKRQARSQALQQLQQRVDQYNQLLTKPGQFALKL